MKRIQKIGISLLAVLTAVILCGTLLPQRVRADGDLAVLSASTTSVTAGSTFTVTAAFTSGSTLISAQMDLGYPASVLDLQKTELISATSAGNGNPFRVVYDSASGTKSASLVKMTFKVSASAAAGTKATVTASNAFGSNEQFSKITLANGSVTITVANPPAASSSKPAASSSKPAATLSSNAQLSSLVLSGVTFSFSPTITEYAVNVPNEVTMLQVTPTAKESAAKVSVSGNSNLKVGSKNFVIVKVTAPDGKTTKQYNITVTRAAAAAVSKPLSSAPASSAGSSSDSTSSVSSAAESGSSSEFTSSALDSSGGASSDADSGWGSSITESDPAETTSSEGAVPSGENSFLQWLRRDRSAWAIHAAYIGGMLICLFAGCMIGYYVRGRKKED